MEHVYGGLLYVCEWAFRTSEKSVRMGVCCMYVGGFSELLKRGTISNNSSNCFLVKAGSRSFLRGGMILLDL